MKLRVIKLTSNDKYIIQKRIFHFLLIEWWVKYNRLPMVFDTFTEAKARIDEIREERIFNKNNKTKEILRFDV